MIPRSFVIWLAVLTFATTGARAQEAPVGTTIADFVGEWRAEYIHDPDNPADNLINSSFDLDLYRNPASPDSLYGWHCSLVRGGRKMDCAEKESGDAPSIRGRLCGDTVYVRFESRWEVVGKAKLHFADPERRALVWKLGEYAPDKEHYMPRWDTLHTVTGAAAEKTGRRRETVADTIPPDGTYRFDIAFAEWQGQSMGKKVTVIIRGDSIRVIYEGDEFWEKGEFENGKIMKHKSGVWIIGNDPADAQLDEVGGCTGGPSVIDFKNKKYWMC